MTSPSPIEPQIAMAARRFAGALTAEALIGHVARVEAALYAFDADGRLLMREAYVEALQPGVADEPA